MMDKGKVYIVANGDFSVGEILIHDGRRWTLTAWDCDNNEVDLQYATSRMVTDEYAAIVWNTLDDSIVYRIEHDVKTKTT